MDTSRTPQNHEVVGTSTTRRNIVRLGLMACLLPAFPHIARAEPVTASQAIAAVMAIFKAVSEANSKQALLDTLDDISEQLNQVINNQYLILNEINSLRVHVKQVSDAAWRAAYGNRISTCHERYTSELVGLRSDKGRLKSGRKTRLTLIYDDVSDYTYDLGRDEAIAFPMYALGVSTSLAIARTIDIDSATIKAVMTNYINHLSRWIDPEKADGLVQTISAMSSANIRDRDALESWGRSITVKNGESHWTQGREYCDQKFKDILTVTGNFSTGYDGNVSRKLGPKNCIRNDRPDVRDYSGFSDDGMPQELREVLLTDVNLTGGSEPVVPVFQPHAYERVNEFNRERIRIYSNMLTAWKLQQYLASITAFRTDMIARRDAM